MIIRTAVAEQDGLVVLGQRPFEVMAVGTIVVSL